MKLEHTVVSAAANITHNPSIDHKSVIKESTKFGEQLNNIKQSDKTPHKHSTIASGIIRTALSFITAIRSFIEGKHTHRNESKNKHESAQLISVSFENKAKSRTAASTIMPRPATNVTDKANQASAQKLQAESAYVRQERPTRSAPPVPTAHSTQPERPDPQVPTAQTTRTDRPASPLPPTASVVPPAPPLPSARSVAPPAPPLPSARSVAPPAPPLPSAPLVAPTAPSTQKGTTNNTFASVINAASNNLRQVSAEMNNATAEVPRHTSITDELKFNLSNKNNQLKSTQAFNKFSLELAAARLADQDESLVLKRAEEEAKNDARIAALLEAEIAEKAKAQQHNNAEALLIANVKRDARGIPVPPPLPINNGNIAKPVSNKNKTDEKPYGLLNSVNRAQGSLIDEYKAKLAQRGVNQAGDKIIRPLDFSTRKNTSISATEMHKQAEPLQKKMPN